MFSGIIETKIKALKIERSEMAMKLYFKIPKSWHLKLGESISVDGVCSTIESLDKNSFSLYYMPETLRKTTFSRISPNHFFNLERCLTLNSLIGGHLVSGHIDTTAQLVSITPEEDSKLLKFQLEEKFTKYIIHKGSIALNGVSLTIVEVGENHFSVSLIPYTLSKTNLGPLKVGDKVNIEVDMIAKYLEKLKLNSSS